MLITDEENRERNHPIFIGQAIWSSVNLEIASCPYFLVCTEIREDGEWFRQTSIVYGLRNLMAVSHRILANENERIVQVTLITTNSSNQDKPWSMHNLQEVWIDETDEWHSKEIYVTEDLQEFYYSHLSATLNSRSKVRVFSIESYM